MKKLKGADELIKSTKSIMAGFNQFIYGMNEPKRSDYADKNQWYSEQHGYDFAKNMAKEHGISFKRVFKCGQIGCLPFNYGGFFVCNSCGRKGVDKSWWDIQVEKDGDQYCCHGLDFINLQESCNYAFGDTFEDAILNYEKVMIEIEKGGDK